MMQLSEYENIHHLFVDYCEPNLKGATADKGVDIMYVILKQKKKLQYFTTKKHCNSGILYKPQFTNDLIYAFTTAKVPIHQLVQCMHSIVSKV